MVVDKIYDSRGLCCTSIYTVVDVQRPEPQNDCGLLAYCLVIILHTYTIVQAMAMDQFYRSKPARHTDTKTNRATAKHSNLLAITGEFPPAPGRPASRRSSQSTFRAGIKTAW